MLKPKLPGFLMAAHGQGGHLEETDEKAEHQGSKNGSLPADPVHAARYGQAIQVGMTATNKRQDKQIQGIKSNITHPLRSA